MSRALCRNRRTISAAYPRGLTLNLPGSLSDFGRRELAECRQAARTAWAGGKKRCRIGNGSCGADVAHGRSQLATASICLRGPLRGEGVPPSHACRQARMSPVFKSRDVLRPPCAPSGASSLHVPRVSCAPCGASAGIALDRDDAILAGEDGLDRFLLALVQPAPVEPGLRDPATHEGFSTPWPARISAMVSDSRASAASVVPVPDDRGRVRRAVAFERGNRALRRIDGDRARLAGQRRRQQVGMAEHRLALGKVRDRPGRRVARRPARTREQVRPEEPAFGLAANRSGPRSPRSALRAAARTLPAEKPSVFAWRFQLRSSTPGRCRAWPPTSSAPPAPRGGDCPSTPPMPRSAIAASISARRVEKASMTSRGTPSISNRPSIWVFPDAVAETLQPLRQFRPVDRPDGHLALEQAVIDHRAPLGILALDHVGDDGMRVELGIQVPGSVVLETGGDRLLAAGADHRPRRKVASGSRRCARRRPPSPSGTPTSARSGSRRGRAGARCRRRFPCARADARLAMRPVVPGVVAISPEIPNALRREAILPMDATMTAASRWTRNERIPADPSLPDMRFDSEEQVSNTLASTTVLLWPQMASNVLPAGACILHGHAVHMRP